MGLIQLPESPRTEAPHGITVAGAIRVAPFKSRSGCAILPTPRLPHGTPPLAYPGVLAAVNELLAEAHDTFEYGHIATVAHKYGAAYHPTRTTFCKLHALGFTSVPAHLLP
jgi:hypothetical protein